MRDHPILAPSLFIPIGLLFGICGIMISAMLEMTPQEKGYEGLLGAHDLQVVQLESHQLNEIAPMATDGTLRMLPGTGFDLRDNGSGQMVENYALACLNLPDGKKTAQMVRFRSGRMIGVNDAELRARIRADKPCESPNGL